MREGNGNNTHAAVQPDEVSSKGFFGSANDDEFEQASRIAEKLKAAGHEGEAKEVEHIKAVERLDTADMTRLRVADID